jgi:hypothetical protein
VAEQGLPNQATRLIESAQGAKAAFRQHEKERPSENIRSRVLEGNGQPRFEPELKFN